MPRFAKMLSEGMKELGHKVEIWSPKPKFYRLGLPDFYKKWLGYLDQYILFPYEIRSRIKTKPADTLYVFADNALGPWVPLVADRPHIIHCHDFLAQRSALDEIPENPTSWTGKKYQLYIREGYRQGKNFISVSHKTKSDLFSFLKSTPPISEVVYNGLNPIYKPGDIRESRILLSSNFRLNLMQGYLLHIGGNQWYKNRVGVIEIYNAWRKKYTHSLPLLLVGQKPSRELLQLVESSVFKEDIHFISGVDDQQVVHAYRGASVFLFPSLAEGFGWPIAEAMACGCRVLTTNEAPMTEVAGNAAELIPCKPRNNEAIQQWAADAANAVEKIITETFEQHLSFVNEGFENSKKYNAEAATARIEHIYKAVLDTYSRPTE
ncbi:glycosyltransferase family 4 protein [Larkinella terrae]|nr:glycosyltransferase family 1 protein [Larkinella terrae]